MISSTPAASCRLPVWHLNQKRYGPMRLDVSANHLHGPTLVSLDKALSAIPVEGVELAQLREQYLETVSAKGCPC